MGEKGELFWGLAGNYGGSAELENHLSIVIIKIVSGKNHQQMVNLGKHFIVEQNIPLVL